MFLIAFRTEIHLKQICDSFLIDMSGLVILFFINGGERKVAVIWGRQYWKSDSGRWKIGTLMLSNRSFCEKQQTTCLENVKCLLLDNSSCGVVGGLQIKIVSVLFPELSPLPY